MFQNGNCKEESRIFEVEFTTCIKTYRLYKQLKERNGDSCCSSNMEKKKENSSVTPRMKPLKNNGSVWITINHHRIQITTFQSLCSLLTILPNFLAMKVESKNGDGGGEPMFAGTISELVENRDPLLLQLLPLLRR